MTKKINIDCPLCKNGSYHVFLEPTHTEEDPAKLYGAASGVRGTQRLVICNECSLVYENPRLPESLILAGYCAADEAGHDSQFNLRVLSFRAALDRLAADIPPKGARVLDIGSAGGAFVQAAQDYGYDAHGLEPCQSLVEAARQRGLQVEAGTIDNNPYPPHSFDMVCYWDVLEHVVDPVGAAQKASLLLKPNGILLINYPDIGTWAARLFGQRFWWILSGHITHFSRATIQVLAEKTNLSLHAFHPYWQTLELGYLFSMAGQLGVPLASTIGKLLPNFLARLRIRYWASQTTALLRCRSDKK